MKGHTELPTLEQMKDAQEIISMCYPIHSDQGGMWFGSNQNFADARFTDYGVCRAFTTAAQALPLAIAVTELVEALERVVKVSASGADTIGFLIELRQISVECATALSHYRELAGTSNLSEGK